MDDGCEEGKKAQHKCKHGCIKEGTRNPRVHKTSNEQSEKRNVITLLQQISPMLMHAKETTRVSLDKQPKRHARESSLFALFSVRTQQRIRPKPTLLVKAKLVLTPVITIRYSTLSDLPPLFTWLLPNHCFPGHWLLCLDPSWSDT